MKLNPQETEDLKSLTEHRGFRILERIRDEKRDSLFGSFENLDTDLSDPKTLEAIKKAQTILRGMDYLIATAKGKSKKPVSKKV